MNSMISGMESKVNMNKSLVLTPDQVANMSVDQIINAAH